MVDWLQKTILKFAYGIFVSSVGKDEVTRWSESREYFDSLGLGIFSDCAVEGGSQQDMYV